MVALGYSGYAAGLECKQGRIPYSIMAVLVGSIIGMTVISTGHKAAFSS